MLKYLSYFLFVSSFLWFPLRCDFFLAEEWFDPQDNAYYVFSDYHTSHPGVSYKQRYDFIKWAYALDASCTIEDGVFHFYLYGETLSKLTFNGTSLGGLAVFCHDLGIPAHNVDFRVMRSVFLQLPQTGSVFKNITGKQIISLTHRALAEIKNYDDGEIANKRYKTEIEVYERIMNEHAAFFAHFNQDISFLTLADTVDPAICVDLARAIDKTYFNLEKSTIDPEQTKVNALNLFDFPLIELLLLHHALLQKKKYRFIATGALHVGRLAYFFEELGFKKGRSFGTPMVVGAPIPEPIDIDQVFSQWSITPTRPEPSNYTLKALGLRSALDQTCLGTLINPATEVAVLGGHAAACFWTSKTITERFFENPSKIKQLAGALALWGASGWLFLAKAKKHACKVHLVQ